MTHSTRWYATIRFIAVSATLVACGGGGDKTPTDPNPNNPNNPGNPTNVTITVVSRNSDENADAGQIYAFVGDAGLTRAQMAANLNENAPLIRYTPGSSRVTATLSVPRGKTVTLFAVEFSTNGNAVDQTGNPIPTQAPRSEVEFVAWEGQTTNVEAGVITVTADGDRTATATYGRVGGVILNILGCIDYRYQNTHPGLLSFGRVIADTPPDLTTTNGFGGVLGGRLSVARDYLYIWGKTGSTITLRARTREDRSPSVLRSGFIRWDGSATSCGTSLTCQILIPARGNSVGPVQMINGYAVSGNNVEGCNCNPLTPQVPCSMRP